MAGWSQESIVNDIMTIMGNRRGKGPMPRSLISRCRGNLGRFILERLGVTTSEPILLDKLIERVLRAVVDRGGDDPDMMAARELLGFTLRSSSEIAAALNDIEHELSRDAIMKGYQAKQVRLYLAGLHCNPQVELRTLHNRQKAVWAPAVANALFDYLYDGPSLAHARELATDLGMQVATGELSGGMQGLENVSASIEAEAQDGLAQAMRPRRSLIANHLHLSGQVRQALEVARDRCRAQHRRFYTFDTLLALLGIPDGAVSKCFDLVREGLAQSVRRELATWPAPGKRVDPFVPVEWIQVPGVEPAWEYALSDGEIVVHDLDLLLAILDGSSATNRWLKRCLGQDHARLREAVVQARHDGPTEYPSPTPD